ncbi:MAG: hypothetical protein QG577_2001 [Thermodesulfobacteriota bacterium]|nr:hypothetical protein [Thermodesulfobacteriota bacterium]
MVFSKQIVFVVSMFLITVLCYPALAKSEVGTTKITNEHAIGAATYEDLIHLAQTIVAQNTEAFNKMFDAGRARSLPTDTEVYVLETRSDNRVYHVRPKGEAFSIWIPQGALR